MTKIKLPADPKKDNELRVTDVARILKIRYHRARDLMLAGQLGPCDTNATGKMVVTAAGVQAWVDRQKEEK